MRGIGVTMSGGGHRASLFGLGVLLYLADAGKMKDVTSIASVSGGSITNGYVAQTLDITAANDGSAFESAMRPFAQQLAQRGSLFASWVTWAFLAVLVVTGLAALAGPWFVPVAGIVQFVILLAALLAWTGFVASRRSWIAARAFRTVFFSPNGKPTLLRDVNGPVDHVICATEMQSAEQLYFAKTFVYGYRYGLGSPGDLMLHDAVQASACLPGGVPGQVAPDVASRLPLRRRRGPSRRPLPGPRGSSREASVRSMVLTDGGVYDNMGDQWALGFRGRRACWPDLETTHSEPHDLVVVNSSAGLGWSELKRSIVPGIGELLTAAQGQRRAVRPDHRDTPASARGSLAPGAGRDRGDARRPHQHPAEPVRRRRRFRGGTRPCGGARCGGHGSARRHIPALDGGCAANSTVKTSLSKMGVDVSARLLHHAYVLAMSNLHVLLDYPLLPMPDRQRFVDLVSSRCPTVRSPPWSPPPVPCSPNSRRSSEWKQMGSVTNSRS